MDTAPQTSVYSDRAARAPGREPSYLPSAPRAGWGQIHTGTPQPTPLHFFGKEKGGLSCLGLRPPPVLPCMAGSWGEETGLWLTAPSCRNLQVGRAGVRGHRPLLPTKPSLPDAPPQPVAALPHPLASLGTDWPQPPGSPVGVRDGGGLHSQDPSCSSRKLICSLRESMRSSCWKEWTSRLPGSGSPRSSAREARLCSGASTSCSFCGAGRGPGWGRGRAPRGQPSPSVPRGFKAGDPNPRAVDRHWSEAGQAQQEVSDGRASE